ncbi:MAG: 16S rRNA (guanine(527)-N(7))-methyltransferase RsmG [Hyphomicrobiaceae bacterium]
MTEKAKTPASQVHISGPKDFAQAFSISRETLERLKIYAGLLETWQRTMNLVAPKTISELWQRHMADSAQLDALAPPGGHWVDFGSGAGFPGLVIAILRAEQDQNRPSEPPQRVTLVESDIKKCAFLAEVVRKTGLKPLIAVEIVSQRIEAPATRSRLGSVQVVSARAVAPLAELLALSAPVFGPETLGLFPKGRGAEAEVEAAKAHWQFTSRLHASCTDREGAIVEIRCPSPRTEG